MSPETLPDPPSVASGELGAGEPLPRGLVFFPPGTPQAVRRRRVLFAYLVVLATIALVWPVFSWVKAPLPLILGLPTSLAWVVLWLVVVFCGLLWLYRGDRHRPEADDPEAGEVER